MVDLKEVSKRPFQENQMMQATKRLRTADETLEIGLLILDKDIGRVIGKGGESVKKIRVESGANVDIPKASNSYDRIVFVRGNVTQICNAIGLIIDIVCEENPMISILAEHRNLGALIGKQGANIKQIREETQANINIGKECLGRSTQKEIRISGDDEAVAKAVESVVTCLAEGRSAVRVPYIPSAAGNINSNPFNADVSGLFLKPQGMSYQNEREDITPSFFHIETTITLPKKMIGKIIGRGGCNINAVRRQSCAQIKISTGDEDADSEESKITITGPRKSIEVACSMLESLARSLGSP